MAVPVKNVQLHVEPESWFGPLPASEGDALDDLLALFWTLDSWRFRKMEVIGGRIILTAYDDDDLATESLFWSLQISGHRVELLDGCIIVHPRPTAWHDEYTAWLAEQLDPACRPNGWARRSDARIAVPAADDSQDVIMPDLAIARSASTRPPTAGLPAERVLLVAEVIAPSSLEADRADKPAACARAGIPVFLLADPIAITVFSSPSPDGYRTGITVQGRSRELYVPAPFDCLLDLDSRPSRPVPGAGQ